jgi:shikimate dehydrogenase
MEETNGNEEGRTGGDALSEQRLRIDRLDREILRLFNERLDTAAAIGDIKRQRGLDIVDPRREAAVFKRLIGMNRGSRLTNRYLVRLFAVLMAAAQDIQGAAAHRPADGFGSPDLFAVFGNPVIHSLSPVMHNAAFAASGTRGVFAAVRVRDIRLAMTGMRALGYKGAAITLPHKEAVLACLDSVDPDARRIGAVNTVVNAAGALRGFNTDKEGAVLALEEKTDLNGRTAAIIGAGGAARAAAFGIRERGGRVIVAARSREKGEALAAAAGAEFRPLAEFSPEEVEILVNSTPVGMLPQTDESPVDVARLRPGLVVMDLVYNPLQTRLLRDSAAAGCTVVDGLAMFVHQGARQFELWTGLEAPVEVMRMAAEAELEPS